MVVQWILNECLEWNLTLQHLEVCFLLSMEWHGPIEQRWKRSFKGPKCLNAVQSQYFRNINLFQSHKSWYFHTIQLQIKVRQVLDLRHETCQSLVLLAQYNWNTSHIPNQQKLPTVSGIKIFFFPFMRNFKTHIDLWRGEFEMEKSSILNCQIVSFGSFFINIRSVLDTITYDFLHKLEVS